MVFMLEEKYVSMHTHTHTHTSENENNEFN